MSDSASPLQIEPISLWASSLFSANFPDHAAIAPELLQRIYEIDSQMSSDIASQVACSAKAALRESQFDFLCDEHPMVQHLHQFLNELVLTVVWEVNQSVWPPQVEAYVDIIESWFHITKFSGFHDVHSHPNCSWCGIYFLDAGGSHLKSGQNRFYDPRVNADHYQDAGTAYIGAQGVMDFAPKAGQVIIFPSYLKHSAMTYFGQQDRVVIAFNAQVHFA